VIENHPTSENNRAILVKEIKSPMKKQFKKNGFEWNVDFLLP